MSYKTAVGPLSAVLPRAAVLRGELEFDAAGFMGTAEGSIAVTASFVAVPASRIAMAAALAGAR